MPPSRYEIYREPYEFPDVDYPRLLVVINEVPYKSLGKECVTIMLLSPALSDSGKGQSSRIL